MCIRDRAQIDTSGWVPGNYLLVVEGQNIDGKWGAPGAIFLTVQGQQQITGLAAHSSSPTVLGNSTNFSATIATGTDVTYAWAYGDGALGNGATAQYTYAAIGDYTAVVTATNTLGDVVAQTSVRVVEPPTPRAYLPLIEGAE